MREQRVREIAESVVAERALRSNQEDEWFAYAKSVGIPKKSRALFVDDAKSSRLTYFPDILVRNIDLIRKYGGSV